MSAATSDSTEQLNICRRTKRGNERCEKVRVVAADLFLAHGYDGVSLDDIIAQSGGSKTNIYSHFGGKEGLFIGIIEGLCDEVHAALAAVDLSASDVEDGLRRLGRALLKAVLDERHLALYRLVIGQSARFPCIGKAWQTHGPEATRRLLTRFLERNRERLRGVTPQQGAVIFHNLLTWDPLNRAVFGLSDATAGVDADALVEETLALFAQGYLR